MPILRLSLLLTLTMAAFAANSLLNRAALVDVGMGPASFAAVRLFSGAVVLAALVAWRGGGWGRPNWMQAVSLAVYALGFSFASVALDAGLGALLLFGGVQVTMFAGSAVLGEAIPMRRWLGAVIAFLGLVWLLWPQGASAPAVGPSILMLAAALGWGVYSLIGRGVPDPLGATAWAFLLAAPFGGLAFAVLPDAITVSGVALACVSGGITSALGYALWYHLLPSLGAARAAIAQLTVPLIAIAGGVLLLGELVTLRMVVAGVLVIAGVWLGLSTSKR
ncbi:MAG: DMT family transporter [Pseudomonadota bacterium]